MMKGEKNLPVSIEHLHTFQKLRQYQPLSFVVEALRSCTNVEVIQHDGKDCVRRKKPFSKTEWAKQHLPPSQPKVKSCAIT